MVNMYLQVPTCNFACISPLFSLSLSLQGCSFIIIIIESGSLHPHLLQQQVSIRTKGVAKEVTLRYFSYYLLHLITEYSNF